MFNRKNYYMATTAEWEALRDAAEADSENEKLDEADDMAYEKYWHLMMNVVSGIEHEASIPSSVALRMVIDDREKFDDIMSRL